MIQGSSSCCNYIHVALIWNHCGWYSTDASSSTLLGECFRASYAREYYIISNHTGAYPSFHTNVNYYALQICERYSEIILGTMFIGAKCWTDWNNETYSGKCNQLVWLNSRWDQGERCGFITHVLSIHTIGQELYVPFQSIFLHYIL